MEKSKIKLFKNIDLFSELSFCEELNVIKTNHTFKGYEISYKVEIIEEKDPIKKLERKNQVLKTSLVIL